MSHSCLSAADRLHFERSFFAVAKADRSVARTSAALANASRCTPRMSDSSIFAAMTLLGFHEMGCEKSQRPTLVSVPSSSIGSAQSSGTAAPRARWCARRRMPSTVA